MPVNASTRPAPCPPGLSLSRSSGFSSEVSSAFSQPPYVSRPRASLWPRPAQRGGSTVIVAFGSSRRGAAKRILPKLGDAPGQAVKGPPKRAPPPTRVQRHQRGEEPGKCQPELNVKDSTGRGQETPLEVAAIADKNVEAHATTILSVSSKFRLSSRACLSRNRAKKRAAKGASAQDRQSHWCAQNHQDAFCQSQTTRRQNQEVGCQGQAIAGTVSERLGQLTSRAAHAHDAAPAGELRSRDLKQLVGAS